MSDDLLTRAAHDAVEIALRKGPPVHQPLGVEDPDELMAEFL